MSDVRDMTKEEVWEQVYAWHRRCLEAEAERDRYKAALRRIEDPEVLDAGWREMRDIAREALVE